MGKFRLLLKSCSYCPFIADKKCVKIQFKWFPTFDLSKRLEPLTIETCIKFSGIIALFNPLTKSDSIYSFKCCLFFNIVHSCLNIKPRFWRG